MRDVVGDSGVQSHRVDAGLHQLAVSEPHGCADDFYGVDEQGLHLSEFRTHSATLEDVFVRLTEGICAMSKLEQSSLYQLTMVRFKLFLREPEAIFWIFCFPILLAMGLGIAFRNGRRMCCSGRDYDATDAGAGRR